MIRFFLQRTSNPRRGLATNLLESCIGHMDFNSTERPRYTTIIGRFRSYPTRACYIEINALVCRIQSIFLMNQKQFANCIKVLTKWLLWFLNSFIRITTFTLCNKVLQWNQCFNDEPKKMLTNVKIPSFQITAMNVLYNADVPRWNMLVSRQPQICAGYLLLQNITQWMWLCTICMQIFTLQMRKIAEHLTFPSQIYSQWIWSASYKFIR